MGELNNPGAQPQDAGAPAVGDSPQQSATSQDLSAATSQGVEPQAPPSAEGGHPGSGGTPKKWAGKYDSPEELEKGYLELRRLLSARGALPDKEAAAQQQQQQVAGVQPPQIDWDAVNESFRRSFEQNPFLTVSQLAQYLALQAIAPVMEELAEWRLERQMLELAADNPDFVDLAPKVKDMIGSDPELRALVRQNPKLLDLVYRAAKATLASEVAQAAKESGRQEAAELNRQKAAASTAPASTRKELQKKSPEEEILDRIFGSERKGIYG